MAHSIRDVMITNPTTLPGSATLADAAQRMRDEDIGDVLIVEDGQLCGIVTDRDIVVRAVAAGRDANTVRLEEICSSDLTTISADDDVQHAVTMMRDHAIRRLPVVEGGRAVGIVSLGDLSLEIDAERALEDISSAPPNN